MAALGVIWESQLMIIEAWRCHTRAPASLGRQAPLTTLSGVGGGLGDGFMAFKCPPPPAS